MPNANGLVLTKLAHVDAGPDDAFRIFTESIGQWWPVKGHSISGDEAEDVVIEGRVGGRVFERRSDGKEILWGYIEVWNPPMRLAFSWHPGQAEPSGQVIEIRCIPTHRGTRVEMEHRGKLKERSDGSIGRTGNIRAFAETVNTRFKSRPDDNEEELVMTKVTNVYGPIEECFKIFTEEIGSWWPLELHTVGGLDTETVVVEPGVGGRVYERSRNGNETLWGHVTAWVPPMRFEMTWHPGKLKASGEKMEMRFTPIKDGTRVEMEHRDTVKDRSGEMEEYGGDEGPLRAFIEAVNRFAAEAS